MTCQPVLKHGFRTFNIQSETSLKDITSKYHEYLIESGNFNAFEFGTSVRPISHWHIAQLFSFVSLHKTNIFY